MASPPAPVSSPPLGLKWRSSTLFILATVTIGLYTDLFLYGLIVPVLPSLLRDRLSVPQSELQAYSSILLATYAGPAFFFSLPAGYIADLAKSRRVPFLSGLITQMASTVLFGVGQNIEVLVLARVLQGMSGAMVWTVGLAMALDTVGVENIGKTMGSIFSVVAVAELAAPVVGGALYAKTGYAGILGISLGLLGLDLLFRLLMVEKKVACQYQPIKSIEPDEPTENSSSSSSSASGPPSGPSEDSPLLPTRSLTTYTLPTSSTTIFKHLPILLTLRSPRLLTALFISFIQAMIIASFEATLATHSAAYYSFTSLEAGLLFIPLDIPFLLLGPLAGWSVDRYGPKPAAVLGFAYLVPALTCLRIPSKGGNDQIAIYAVVLALCGVGLGVIGAPPTVEQTAVVEKFERENAQGFFGANGPYAQLYGLNSMVFSAGLTIGPVLAGGLRDRIGYGDMYVVEAAMAAVAAVLSFVYIGGKPACLRSKRREEMDP